MDKILLKMFKKYFVYKIQDEWKDELSKIDDKDLKEWMDDDLLSKMDYVAEDILRDLKESLIEKWEYELYYDINNFVEDWKDDKEREEKEKETWNTDENIDDKKTMMICDETDPNDSNCIKCTHSIPHIADDACNEHCDTKLTHEKCIVWEQEDLEEIMEAGGI